MHLMFKKKDFKMVFKIFVYFDGMVPSGPRDAHDPCGRGPTGHGPTDPVTQSDGWPKGHGIGLCTSVFFAQKK